LGAALGLVGARSAHARAAHPKYHAEKARAAAAQARPAAPPMRAAAGKGADGVTMALLMGRDVEETVPDPDGVGVPLLLGLSVVEGVVEANRVSVKLLLCVGEGVSDGEGVMLDVADGKTHASVTLPPWPSPLTPAPEKGIRAVA
jgi:hypothetical protein